MSGSRPELALSALLARTRQIAACVAQPPLLARRDRDNRFAGYMSFVPEAVRLRTHHRRYALLFAVRHHYDVSVADDATGVYVARTTAYSYRVLDSDHKEILAYHWHPTGVSSVTHPHLHLSSQIRPLALGRAQDALPLADMHIASGQVALAHVVRMLIEEFGVAPLRDDWAAALGG